jgi:hypothetical protein
VSSQRPAANGSSADESASTRTSASLAPNPVSTFVRIAKPRISALIATASAANSIAPAAISARRRSRSTPIGRTMRERRCPEA